MPHAVNISRERQIDSFMRHQSPPGALPGTMDIDPQAPQPRIRIMVYGEKDVSESDVTDPNEIRKLIDTRRVTWVNVSGLGNASILQTLGDIFSLHQLALEDVVNVHQRAKIEEYENNLFIVVRTVQLQLNTERLETEQLSLFLGANFVVTFQEGMLEDCLEPIRERIRHQQGEIRESGADYLAYAVLDAALDQYFPVLETYGERLETLENVIIDRPGHGTVMSIHTIKRALLTLRRTIWPQQDMFNVLLRDHSVFLTDHTRLHLRDCYDHAVRLIDILETYRELGADLMGVYLSSLGQRTNETMRVLTVIATLFIPLTFITGVYGMNFDPTVSPWNLPELEWYWGYPFSLFLMLLIVVAELIFFWRKGWIGSRREAGRLITERDS